MLQLLGSDPFLLPIHELDGKAIEGWNIFQSILFKSAGFVFVDELGFNYQKGWNSLQSAMFKSSSNLNSFSIDGFTIPRNTIRYCDLFNERSFGISLEQQQSAVANLMISLDPDMALQIMLGQEY